MNEQVVVRPEHIELPGEVSGSFDVYFDDRHVWSFTREEPSPGRRTVTWPRPMQRWLDGVADVVVRQGDDGAGLHRGQVRDLDRAGRHGRRRRRSGDDRQVGTGPATVLRPGEGVVDQLVDVTEQTLDVLEQECGVHAWLAFGSLLGAVRDGRAIAHDSDVDVAFLSSSDTPAGVNREIYGITRALRRAGLRVVNKSGGFVTVMFKAPDGAPGSLDIYSCFYVDDLLHETATVRTAVPRSAVEPLGDSRFEGRGPARARRPRHDARHVSYGEGWRVPDPSFQHRPGRAVTERFEDWQGTLMTGRRAWEHAHRQEPDALAGRAHGLRRLGLRAACAPGSHVGRPRLSAPVATCSTTRATATAPPVSTTVAAP